MPAGTLRRPERCGIGPATSDQVAMPAQQGLGLDEEPPPASATEEAAQSGEQRPVRMVAALGGPPGGEGRPLRGGA